MSKKNVTSSDKDYEYIIQSISNLCGRIDNLCDKIDNLGSHNPRRNKINFEGRTFKNPSEVVPDQTFTVRQLFERAIVNSYPLAAKPFYAEDTNDIDILFNRSGIDLSTLDLTELDDYKESLSERIEYHKQQIKNSAIQKKSEEIPE